jgi:hypothetical protein
MHRIARTFVVAVLIVAACGGSNSSSVTGTNNNASGPMSAIIDGQAWASPVPQAVYKGNILSVAGIDLGITASVSFASSVSGTGTYSLSYGNQLAGSGGVSKTGRGWTSGLPGGTGTLTLTTLTANHVAGTFAFDAVAATGGATGTIHVTGGKFDITF